jgi:radical SAM protein with 4Fe4S-binding SPASM domain
MKKGESPEASKRHRSSSRQFIRYAIEELRFVRSIKSFRNFLDKIKIVLLRVTRRNDRFYRTPPILQIEPTNYCNAECISCPTSRSSRPRGHMDIDLFRRIIDDASEMGVKWIFLFLHGEPLLHPEIVEMIRYVKSKGLAFHMTTNGVPLDEKKIRGILGSGVDNADHVSFSVLGASEEVHNMIFRREYYERVVRNIALFLRLRKGLKVNGPVIETIFYTMPENQHEESDFARKWRGVVDHVRMSGEISQSFSEYKQDGVQHHVRKDVCSNLWEKMTIFWDGRVTLCCQDVDGDWILGNLNHQTISEVWNNERLLAIKRIHKRKQLELVPFCYACDM